MMNEATTASLSVFYERSCRSPMEHVFLLGKIGTAVSKIKYLLTLSIRTVETQKSINIDLMLR